MYLLLVSNRNRLKEIVVVEFEVVVEIRSGKCILEQSVYFLQILVFLTFKEKWFKNYIPPLLKGKMVSIIVERYF